MKASPDLGNEMTMTEIIQCKNKAAAGVLNGLSLAHIFDHGRAPSLPSSCFTGRAQPEMLAQGVRGELACFPTTRIGKCYCKYVSESRERDEKRDYDGSEWVLPKNLRTVSDVTTLPCVSKLRRTSRKKSAAIVTLALSIIPVGNAVNYHGWRLAILMLKSALGRWMCLHMQH